MVSVGTRRAIAAGLVFIGVHAPQSGAQIGNGECDRACLEGFVDRYLDAVIDNDPAAVPLADNVRFTENGQQLLIGDGLWNTMKSKGSYRLFVADVPAGQVGFIGTIEEDHRDPALGTGALLGLRLRIEDDAISEIEQFVARDTGAWERVRAMGTPRPAFTETIPPRERMSRMELIATANKYFTGMQQNDGKGDYPFSPDCDRYENGGHSTNVPTPPGETRPDPRTASSYSAQWSCREQFESGLLYFVYRIRDRRFVAVDEERGVVFSFVFFDHPGGSTRHFDAANGRPIVAGPTQPWTWYIVELFKIESGEIAEIEALLQRVPYGMLSGWSTWEAGMSDRAQDATL
ncbi:MAG TPA: hypothetical protein VKQ06_12470 [Gammaproteobacteria bacterium]|nr:hypothetical protein [Gammaproteobacteria bacterium]